jgi:OOP family OmpA-OmpF porin
MGILNRRLCWAASAVCAVIATSPAPGQTTATPPSQEEIGRQLKFRGLPTLGTRPATPPGPAPEVMPANVPAAPPPLHETRHHPVHPAVTHQVTTPAAAPSMTLRTITFEFGSAQLRPESIDTLRNLGHALNQDLKDEKAFVIEGHTDRTGSRAYNDMLSKRRADTVKEYLVGEMGVSADRLQTVGRGFSEPADPRHPYAADNRRVVVINVGPS